MDKVISCYGQLGVMAILDLKLNKDDRSDDPSANLRKKIKFEHDFIISRAKSVNENLNLTDHEVNKFLIIFHTLLETIDINSEISELEETDGIVTDIILQIVLKISSLIRQNVDSLPLPQILKDALKVIKEIDTELDGGGGVLWRRNLRNVPARQAAAAAAAAAKQPTPPPPPAAAIPAPLPFPPIQPPAQAPVQRRIAHRG